RVTFDRAMSTSTFTPGDVVLTGPRGQRITVTSVKVVSGSSNRAFDITFATQTAAGPYSLRIAPAEISPTRPQMTVYATTPRLGPRPPAFTLPRGVRAAPSGPPATALVRFRVTFDRAMSTSTFSPADVVLTGPSGKRITVSAVKVVPGWGNRAFDITFATR